LTGVPPLMAPGKSSAVTSTAPGNKASAIPKRVRRLLAQMLSTDPEARPQDPVEFYRTLQDCLVQVERREAVSHRFGVLPFSRRPGHMPGSRRMSMKPLALAALFLTVATLAALVVPGYLHHRQIVRAEKPIGVPIGVAGTPAAETPAPADAANALASNPKQTTSVVAQSNGPPSESTMTIEGNNTSPLPANAIASNGSQTTTVAQSNETASAPTGRTEPSNTNSLPANGVASNSTQTTSIEPQSHYQPSAAAGSTERNDTKALPPDPGDRIAKNQIVMASPEPHGLDSRPGSQTQKPAEVRTGTGSSDMASANRPEPNPPPAQSPTTVDQRTAQKKFAMHEVRRAEPAEPEVRRAEPPSPEEGPAADTSETTASSKPQTNPRAQIDERRDVENETAENSSRAAKRTDSESNAAAPPRTKSERPPKQRRRMDERIYPPQPIPDSEGRLPPLPRRSFRARFVGVTPDGQWMLLLPSNRIVVVPPPQGGVDPRYR
jgi:hypothetical protein